jgi:hypothetical protein
MLAWPVKLKYELGLFSLYSHNRHSQIEAKILDWIPYLQGLEFNIVKEYDNAEN